MKLYTCCGCCLLVSREFRKKDMYKYLKRNLARITILQVFFKMRRNFEKSKIPWKSRIMVLFLGISKNQPHRSKTWKILLKRKAVWRECPVLKRNPLILVMHECDGSNPTGDFISSAWNHTTLTIWWDNLLNFCTHCSVLKPRRILSTFSSTKKNF